MPTLPRYDIWIHHHGRKPVCVDTVDGSKKSGTPKRAALDAAKVWYPQLDIAWDNDTALLVKQEGIVIATIAIEPGK